MDPRIESYARLLVERCLDVQPGWQVVVGSHPPARPLVEEIIRLIARRGAYAIPRLTFESFTNVWLDEASEELLSEMPPIERQTYELADAFMTIQAPENTREGAGVDPAKLNFARRPRMELMRRVLNLELPWVGCQYPTPALAQDAGMSLHGFEDFLYGACLLDWDAEAEKMRRYADRFDAAGEIRITGDGTDILIGLEGREAKIDDGKLNMPGGEFFYSPVEDATEGVITYSEFPAVYGSKEVHGVRLEFKAGTIVDATAKAGEDFLLATLDADEGARVLGELGIGCNPGIRNHMRNTLYDEKIYGTVHLAIGNGFPFIGGKNVSSVHWDMVKDLRNGGAIHLDGELVQRNGEWVI